METLCKKQRLRRLEPWGKRRPKPLLRLWGLVRFERLRRSGSYSKKSQIIYAPMWKYILPQGSVGSKSKVEFELDVINKASVSERPKKLVITKVQTFGSDHQIDKRYVSKTLPMSSGESESLIS
jgi:hypothetical protein